MTSRRSPLARVRGLGTAREGVAHWWAQRLTAVALVPLLLWFAASLCAMTGADQQEVRAWIADPLVSVLLILLTVAGFHHAQLGLQVVLEDYVHAEWLKVASVVLVKFAAVALAVAAVLSVVRIALGG